MPDRVKFLMSFRGRLMLLLTGFLVLTIALVLLLDRWAQRHATAELVRQSQQVKTAFNTSFGDFAQAVSLSLQSLASESYLYEVIGHIEMPSTLKAIVVADENGLVKDSTLRELIKQKVEVPPLPQGFAASQDIEPVEGQVEIEGGLIKTYDIPIMTEKGGHWIVIVMQQDAIINQIDTAQMALADKNRQLSNFRLAGTTGLLTLALGITVVIGWRFTKPIEELAMAARRVASGDLDFRVGISRRDEVGELAGTFNEMIGGLKSKLELEERLNQSERAAAIGRLTQAVAHEIRNPLNVINLAVDQVKAKYPPDDEKQRSQFLRLVSSIKDEIGRLRHMVNDVLNYGRPAHLAAEKLDLKNLMASTLELVRPQADVQGVEISLELDDVSATVVGDAERLKSCLSNLTINALQAMPSGGKLMARVRRLQGQVELSIRDTGIGMSQESLSKIFEPYFSTKQSGFGLGLAVTKKIIEDHHGSIDVQSQVNQGTTFTLRLPAANGEPESR
jgi:signal transduction histidine kinase